MRKEPRKVLISHHWAVSQIPAERFGDDVYCVNHDRHPDFGHSRVLRVPFGQAYDVADVIKKLPNGWEPDLFVAKVDAFFNQVPVNVAPFISLIINGIISGITGWPGSMIYIGCPGCF
jgi:hypothetical protein